MTKPASKKTPSVEVSQTQRERLAYLEMRAWFAGEVRRPDIETRFGVKPAAASRDLTSYKTAAPRNLEYDATARCYRPTASFKPIFGFTPERVLSWMSQGFGDGLEPRPRKAFPCEGPVPMAVPGLDVLAAVTRAIHGGRALKISYLSLSSGKAGREIVPVALADDGMRWHVRAFDRKNGRFSDFALRRIEKAEAFGDAREGEGLADDEQWSRIVDLELVPHPKARWPEGVAADYAMDQGVLRVRVRAALAGYFLRRHNVDCSPDGSLEPSWHHLSLNNKETLYGVESATLAPGRAASAAQERKGETTCLD